MECKVCLEERAPKGPVLRLFEVSLEEVKKRLEGFSFSYRVSLSGIDLFFCSRNELKKAKELLRPFVYSEGPPLEEAVGKRLKELGLTLSCAESCTGGLVSARVVNVPGSSAYFKGGVVAYANELKVSLLGVPEELISRFGAVSRPVCHEMLEGLRRRFKTDCGIAVTGIAGPGGSERKPEGLTYVGVYAKGKQVILKRVFKGERNEKRFLSSQTALFYLLKLLER
ncbi:MAG: CinA family protein [Aquificae bacterium]|nr:CinA family protein [Aquificota bacterium]